MSRCFSAPVRASRHVKSACAPPRTLPVHRRDIHSRAKVTSTLTKTSFISGFGLSSRYSHSLVSEQTSGSGPASVPSVEQHSEGPFVQNSARCAAHLNGVFPSLQFPPELAQRILTHGSHKAAIHGHNGRLSFVGRRVLETYFLLFLHSVARNQHRYDYEILASRALNTYLLGEHVAPKWSLGCVLRWVPTVSSDVLRTHTGSTSSRNPDAELQTALSANPGVIRSVGLYKVMGDAVQAVMGGIYHQFGGSVAHRVFHTRLLPHVLLPGKAEGLPAEFHQRALDICERMGGTDGSLLLEGPSSKKPAPELELAEVVHESMV
ncbi:hypothetical protein BV22DRAFT_1022549 [Leucogyrophana mollusca]|uniref:Uncharacterized protein n=1 Tax=Leucogyrophana mollusca TaxID=85980 RepID=A0ACB8B205_9AGAM|nr:hypothetical protein BV22DRAFT_1022549 [Leucogyrophana mollusca]